MAESLTKVIQARKKVIDNLYRLLKKTDNLVEYQERYLKRVRSRKRVVPEIKDLDYLSEMEKQTVDALSEYDAILRQGFPI
jgi:hypothetical protein